MAAVSLWVSRSQPDAEIGMTSDSKSTLLDAEALVIRLGEGIGTVSFGAKRDDVIAAIGSPAVSNKANGFDTMEYPELGFWILCHDREGFLQFNGFSALRARVINGYVSYAGKTEDGIGIGSSKDDVEGALGKPSKGFETNTWSYKSPKVSFEFSQDQVIAIGMTWDGYNRP